VFFGKFIKSDTLSKADAAHDSLYSIFFKKNGDFKNHAVLKGKFSVLRNLTTHLRRSNQAEIHLQARLFATKLSNEELFFRSHAFNPTAHSLPLMLEWNLDKPHNLQHE
jgi:hypothetical protein